MLSIRVLRAGSKPKVLRVPPPPVPVDNSMAQIRVIAAGLHHVVRKRAIGQHYSTSAEPNTPGIDGTGVDLRSGKTVYFITTEGSFSELVNVSTKQIWDIPNGVDPVQAAALMNPLLSSWLALRTRVDSLRMERQEGWSCFIMGASSISGRLAVKVAREFGAAEVIGASRGEVELTRLGLDAHVSLQDPPKTTDFAPAKDADVVLDYLYGPYVSAFFSGTRSQKPLTWISIGAIAGADAEIPSSALRSRDLTLRGSGVGAWNPFEAMKEVPTAIQLLKGVKVESVSPVPMENAEASWDILDKRVVCVTPYGEELRKCDG